MHRRSSKYQTSGWLCKSFYLHIGGYMHRSRKPITRGRHKRKTQSPTPSVLEEHTSTDYFPDIDERLERWRARRRMALLAPLTYNCALTSPDELSQVRFDLCKRSTFPMYCLFCPKEKSQIHEPITCRGKCKIEKTEGSISRK